MRKISNLDRARGFEKGWGGRKRTEVVDDDAAVGEAAGRAVSVEVPAVWWAVGAGEGTEIVVGAAVDGGVAEDEECGGERGSRKRGGGGGRQRRMRLRAGVDGFDGGDDGVDEEIDGEVFAFLKGRVG